MTGSALLMVTLCFAHGAAAATPESRAASHRSPSFIVHFVPGQTSAEEARVVAERAEQLYARLAEYLGRKTERKIVIRLEGNRGDDPKHRWPYVDTTIGALHLFRFPEDTFPYEAGLSHELVHAFRFEHLRRVRHPSPAFVFLEEGLAEFLSNRIAPRKAVFPNYGHSLEVAAGQWLANNQAIPLRTLLNEQFNLRPKCIAQAYTQQPSFIQFIEHELGRETVRRLAYATDIEREASFTRYLGARFSVWTKRWQRWLSQRFEAVPKHRALGSAWRTKTPVSAMYVCRKGVDY